MAKRRFGNGRLAFLNGSLTRAALLNWGIVLFGLVMAQGVGAVVTVVVARLVVPVNFGQFLACYGLASLLIVVPTLGLDNWLLAQGETDRARIGQLWRSALRTRLWLLAAWVVALLALGLVLPKDTYPWAVLVPTTLGVAADSVESLAFSALRLLGQHRRVTVLQSIFALLSLATVALLPLFSARIVVFAIGRAVVSVGSALTVVALLGRTFVRPASAAPAPAVARSARPFWAGDVAVLVYSRVSLSLISLLVGAIGTAAFGSADNFINLVFWVPNALYFLVLPPLARAQAGQRPARFARLALAQLGAQALVGLALSVGVYVLAPVLIRTVYGGAYAAAIPILQWFSPIPFFKSLNFGLGAWLTGGSRQAARTWMQVGVAIFTVIAGLLAISRWGLAGAAGVEVATEILLTAGYAVLVGLRWRVGQSIQQSR